jgi:hypothetical protein
MPRKSIPEKPIVVSTSGAAAAPARRKPSTPKRVTRSAEFSVTAVAAGPSLDAIARLAYSYWEARGCQGGSPEEDWLRAEQELRAVAN